MSFHSFMWFFVVLYLALTAVACVGCVPTQERGYELSDTGNYCEDVWFRVSEIEHRGSNGGYTSGYVKVYFQKRSHDADFNCVVQEVQSPFGTLVEAFTLNTFGDEHADFHTWTDNPAPHTRRMTVYLAKVEGADWTSGGFCHLPQNIDGSVVTEIPDNFNQSYQDKRETRGSIVRRSAHEFTWSITDDGQKITVRVPSVEFEREGDSDAE